MQKERVNIMTRKELMNELKNMNVAYKATMKTEELEKLYNDATSTTEVEESNFTELKKLLNQIDDCYIINETARRLTTNSVMFCKRANNKVRAYLKKKANHELATERNTQYDANVLIDLNDDYAIYTLRRLYR